MNSNLQFQSLIERARKRDQQAAAELVRVFSHGLQVSVRHRLNQWRLQQVLDPEDITQAVLAEFFDRLARGELSFEDPAHAGRFLSRIARNRVLDEVRKVLTVRRGGGQRATTNSEECLDGIASNCGTPSAAVSAAEMIHTVYERLSPDERDLAVRRSRGDDWSEIAEQTGGSAEALRKKLTRAFERVLEELNLSPK